MIPILPILVVLPIDATVKRIIYAVAIVLCVLWVLGLVWPALWVGLGAGAGTIRR